MSFAFVPLNTVPVEHPKKNWTQCLKRQATSPTNTMNDERTKD